jgi:hypothetical protein
MRIHLRHAQREAHIRSDVHVRVERIVLEHHSDTALTRLKIGHIATPDPDLAVVSIFEAGNEAQKRRLPAAGRPEQHEKLSVCDGEIDSVKNRHATKGLANTAKLNLCQRYLPVLSANHPTIFEPMLTCAIIGVKLVS